MKKNSFFKGSSLVSLILLAISILLCILAPIVFDYNRNIAFIIIVCFTVLETFILGFILLKDKSLSIVKLIALLLICSTMYSSTDDMSSAKYNDNLPNVPGTYDVNIEDDLAYREYQKPDISITDIERVYFSNICDYMIDIENHYLFEGSYASKTVYDYEHQFDITDAEMDKFINLISASLLTFPEEYNNDPDTYRFKFIIVSKNGTVYSYLSGNSIYDERNGVFNQLFDYANDVTLKHYDTAFDYDKPFPTIISLLSLFSIIGIAIKVVIYALKNKHKNNQIRADKASQAIIKKINTNSKRKFIFAEFKNYIRNVLSDVYSVPDYSSIKNKITEPAFNRLLEDKTIIKLPNIELTSFNRKDDKEYLSVKLYGDISAVSIELVRDESEEDDHGRCPHCGAELNGSNKCAYCGTVVNSEWKIIGVESTNSLSNIVNTKKQK